MLISLFWVIGTLYFLYGNFLFKSHTSLNRNFGNLRLLLFRGETYLSNWVEKTSFNPVGTNFIIKSMYFLYVNEHMTFLYTKLEGIFLT